MSPNIFFEHISFNFYGIKIINDINVTEFACI